VGIDARTSTFVTHGFLVIFGFRMIRTDMSLIWYGYLIFSGKASVVLVF
jgi:hypothetical protein